ncbi:MAG TPA: hypothetical protein VF614_02290 [Chthoniobacteraceae bacterium]
MSTPFLSRRHVFARSSSGAGECGLAPYHRSGWAKVRRIFSDPDLTKAAIAALTGAALILGLGGMK